MKKFFVAISLILIWCLMIVSCNTNHVDTSLDSNINNTQSNTNNQDTTGTLAPNDNKDLDNQDILDTLVPNDEEFPFDNIIVERNGYDIVAAGKYYGNDFDSVTDYGSYYRIIDNYEDFSELTQWGNQLDETVFNENFVLALYSYSNCNVYYSHPNFNELNGLGQFKDLKMDTSTDKLSIYEIWSLNDGMPDTDNYTPLDYNDYEVVFPKEVHEIVYLIIPKKELPNSMHINGEVKLRKGISKAE